MLIQGNLVKPLDWFDLLFHGVPWILLFLKILAYGIKKK
jgi:Na+-transporting methylmalonyl-CoA/oxaloacetate decarboxylase gamma subunit